MSSEKAKTFAKKLLKWRKSHNFDREFSWRSSQDPYVILISELLLRKTTRRQVADHLNQFLKQYPNFETLARASVGKIKSLVRPLGMENLRAPILKQLAKTMVREHDGLVPISERALLQLPGVGRYTSNAVLCFSGNRDEPLVDTNMIRVLGRVFSFTSDTGRIRTDPRLWNFARNLIPKGKGREFNLGMLDFAAHVCTSIKPRCSECPMTATCDYFTKRQLSPST